MMINGLSLAVIVGVCATGVLPVALLTFIRWAWAWPGIRTLVGRPDLRGTWKGTVHPRSRGSSESIARTRRSIEAYFVVHQTFSSLHLRMLTPESHSMTLAASLLREPDGVLTINGIYRNEPRLSVRSGSPIHHGGIVLKLSDPPASLCGHYWTDRQSDGELYFRLMTRKRLNDFQAAHGAAFSDEESSPSSDAEKPDGASEQRSITGDLPGQDADARSHLLRCMNALLPAQFEQFLTRLNIPSHILSPATQPQATRATEVLRYLEQKDRVAEAVRSLSSE